MSTWFKTFLAALIVFFGFVFLTVIGSNRDNAIARYERSVVSPALKPATRAVPAPPVPTYAWQQIAAEKFSLEPGAATFFMGEGRTRVHLSASSPVELMTPCADRTSILETTAECGPGSVTIRDTRNGATSSGAAAVALSVIMRNSNIAERQIAPNTVSIRVEEYRCISACDPSYSR
jgi:hypothetical protein